MRKVAFILLFGVLAGVSAQAHEGQTSSQTVVLGLGRTKTIDRGRVAVRFIDVVEDSRCPANVQCIQAGSVRIKIRVTRGRQNNIFILRSGGQDAPARFAGYSFTLSDVAPERQSDRQPAPSRYRATIVATPL